MIQIKRGAPAAGLAAIALIVAGCGSGDTSATGADGVASASPSAAPVIDPGDGGRYQPDVDPANFVDVVDNPYLPLLPGSRWVYEGKSDGRAERNEVVVTDERRDIMGISAVVVQDTVYAAGKVVEDTFDWYAQDKDGNVWYLGEDSTAYAEDGTTSKEGSWEFGVDGAQPGIIMPGAPNVGAAYRQEYYAGAAVDLAEVLRLGETRAIGLGEYTDVVVTEEWTPLEPEIIANKYYAPGVGEIYSEHAAGAPESGELVKFIAGG